jgi:hypothetical protein
MAAEPTSYDGGKMAYAIYVIGPYQSDPIKGALNAIHAGDQLWAMGFTPVIPHLTIIWDVVSPKPRPEWLKYGKELLTLCKGAYRLPGESENGDDEEKECLQIGIPVFTDLDKLWQYYRKWGETIAKLESMPAKFVLTPFGPLAEGRLEDFKQAFDSASIGRTDEQEIVKDEQEIDKTP